ncbi:23S rRNA (uracil1939-C5)-methyltransferase [Breznakia blatticola]|uniref:23S rRNA (Uracil1939-C5)-methyltransferase n=1 Tax=Breznakia blatticola TaxID=1754012 RepID=A0A4V3G7Z6_9FIRM|nr:23S rRNA (uracil(1939)-C(5))-methyltransferase RlmD [Breznakia blatticola]TDW20984.1 23S rRNA (uracil1939-C5)-methyltransferase [Breznakia blatticola]
MKKRELLQGTVSDYTYDGMGVVKVDNFTYFVRGVLLHEEIEFLILKRNKKLGYGKVERILKESEHRITPSCPYYPKCGGCHIMHMDYEAQLDFKHRIVKQNIQNIGKLDIDVRKPLASNTSHYRNKAQFPAQGHPFAMGFYRLRSNDLVDIDTCLVQSELIDTIYAELRTIKNTSFVDDVRHVLIKHAFVSGEVMVAFIMRKDHKEEIAAFMKPLLDRYPIVSLLQNINTRNDNVILGDHIDVIDGKAYIVEELDGLKFQISLHSFFQINPKQTIHLYNEAIKSANITNEDRVIDLYCGVGSITLFLARQAKHVTGVEIVAPAIENAKINQQLNQMDNVTFICSDAGTYANKIVSSKKYPDVVFVDPPRKGLDTLTIESTVKMKPRTIAYISCNPATLARDIAIYKEHGYTCEYVQPVDMFPNTYHVECVVLLQRAIS